MKKIKVIVLIFSTLVFFCSMRFIEPIKDISKAAWMIGTWVNKTPKGEVYESWTKKGKKELTGVSYKISDKDTIVLENIRLFSKQNKLFYVPTVKNQNLGLPVIFEATVVSDTLLVFENPNHDFPQLISYRRNEDDSLTAEISGIINRENKRIIFPMKRVHQTEK